MKNTEKTMEKIVALCKNRGFIFAGSEIYGGLANTWDYGPLGVELKNNVKKAWWKKFVQENPYNVGQDSAILMNPQTWVASGHLGGFSDPLMDCKDCKTRHRADKLIEDTGVKIDITDDGAVSVCGTDQEMMDKAVEMIRIITTDFEAGQIFKGTVVSIKEFGAFIEFAPGKEGMVHISKIAKERINHVEDVLTLGDKVTVVCLGKDKMGRISFSMKDVPKEAK